MSKTSPNQNDKFSDRSLIRALKSWKDTTALGKHPLAQLKFVIDKHRATTRPNTYDGLGKSLKEVLEQILKELPADHRKILEIQYIQRKRPKYTAKKVLMSERNYYRQKNIALRHMATILYEREEAYRLSPPVKEKQKQFKVPSPLEQELVGRSEIFRQLKQQLTKTGRTALALTGMPGVGKTSLALELVYDDDISQHFSDNILWAGLGKERDTSALLKEWAIQLDIHPEEFRKSNDTKELATRIRQEIGDRRFLVVVDDAWQQEAVAQFFQARGRRCSFLLTTRFPKIASRYCGSNIYRVSELSLEDGYDLLSRLALNAVETDPAAARDLVNEVGALPLALILMGHFLGAVSHAKQERRIRNAIERLKNAKERFKLAEPKFEEDHFPGLPEDAGVSLNSVISLSYESLHEQSKILLGALACLPPKPNTIAEETARNVLNDSMEGLDQLVDSGLLEAFSSDRYALHQTIASYTLTNQKLRIPYEQMIEYYVNFTKQHQENHDLLAPEAQNILAMLAKAHEQGLDYYLFDGMRAIYPFLETRGMYTSALDIAALAYQRAKKSRDRRLMAEAAIFQGRVNNAQSKYKKAKRLFEQALIWLREIKDPELTCIALEGLGVATGNLGDLDEAKPHWIEALDLARINNYKKRMCDLLQNLGAVEIHRGHYDQAEVYLSEGLNISRQINYRLRESTILANLASVKNSQGEPELAEEYLLDSLQITREINYDANLIFILSQLAGNALSQKKPELALDWIQKALPLTEQIGSPQQRSHLYRNWGEATGRLGDYPQSVQHFEQSMKIARSIDNLLLVGSILDEYGEIQLLYQDIEAATKTYQDLEIIADEIDKKQDLGAAWYGLARVAALRGDYTRAKELGTKSLEAFSETKDQRADDVRRFLANLPER